MKIIKGMLEKIKDAAKKHPLLNKLAPIIEATDEFFLGTDKTTRFAPHILDGIDIKRYMIFVIVALFPAALAGTYFYGLKVMALICVSYIFGGLTETAFSVIRRRPIHEGFLVTGLIFPLILPPTIPLWMAALGVTFGVFFGKEVFGGTGRNIFNPALVGRVFLSMAFPAYFTTMWQEPLGGTDAITSATPLIDFKNSHILADPLSLLLGGTPGSIGETFRIGIIIGGLFLMLAKLSDWRIPLSYLLSVAALSFFGNKAISSALFAPPLFQLLSGGILFGAFFMATDPVTSPLTFEGKWVFGILLGVLTVLIRALSGFVESVMFAILLMNALTPFIDAVVLNIKFKGINQRP